MTLDQLLPQLSGLSRADKWQVVQTLTKELADDASVQVKADQNHAVWSPYDANEAAETLLSFLRATKGNDVGE